MVNRKQHTNKMSRPGFTLMEILVVIAIIALIMAMVFAALNRATITAKRSASERSASALAQSVVNFRNEFGFLPPLVHDGLSVSAGDDDYRPLRVDPTDSPIDGPLLRHDEDPALPVIYTVVVWSEGLDFNFFRRREGSGADEIKLANGSGWDIDGAWEDRRYSKYSLAYYLTGALDRDIDGVRGPGFVRPAIDGTYEGVGYPVGFRSSGERFAPMMDVDRPGVRIAVQYVEPNEVPEHDLGTSAPPSYDDVFNFYADARIKDSLVSLVDAFGTAFRYYRWERGRFDSDTGQLVVEDQLDFNLPPILIDPIVLSQMENNPAMLDDLDLTGGNMKLREARFAIISAGPDRLFGTESIDLLAKTLGVSTVPTDVNEIAALRKSVWVDNAVEIGN